MPNSTFSGFKEQKLETSYNKTVFAFIYITQRVLVKAIKLLEAHELANNLIEDKEMQIFRLAYSKM